MRYSRIAALVVVASLGMVGCSSHHAPKPLHAIESSAPPPPAYSDDLAPSEAAMLFTPTAATKLEVTDYDQIKLIAGFDKVTGKSSDSDQRDYWKQADSEAAQTTGGLLRKVDDKLRSGYGWGAADVKWEASFSGGASGYVIRVRDKVKPMKAIRAGVGPLKGASYDPDTHLITKDAMAPGDPSWASDPDMMSVVGGPATSAYVAKGCVKSVTPPSTVRLDPVKAYAVEFGGGLATVKLGSDRHDLAERIKLNQQVPAYKTIFEHAVEDPGTGRIGFRVQDPVAAAALVRDQPLPYAACD